MRALANIILILFLGLASADAFGENVSNRQNVSKTQHRDRANQLMASGDLAAAIDEYRKAIEAGEADAPAIRNELGIALAESGEIDAAIREFRTALRDRAGEFALAHYNLGVALMEKGDFAGAESELKAGIGHRKEKRFPEGHNTLGFLYTRIGNTEAALAEFRKAIDESGGVYAQAHYNLGVLLYEMGKVSESVLEFKSAIEQSKTFPDAHYNLGAALEDLGRNAEAAQAFEQYLAQSVNPKDRDFVRQRICRLRAQLENP
jgi:tetratricopeptide (TPR) repeat protein